MNPLQQLIQTWVDAEQGRSLRQLALRAEIPPSTLYAIMDRDDPKSTPRDETIQALSDVLDVGYQTVKDAAGAAANYTIEGPFDLGPSQRAFIAVTDELAELSPERYEELWEIAQNSLRRARKSAPRRRRGGKPPAE